jgi:hypothetical protein
MTENGRFGALSCSGAAKSYTLLFLKLVRDGESRVSEIGRFRLLLKGKGCLGDSIIENNLKSGL